MDDSKPIPREHERAIREAIDTLVAAQFRAIKASQRLQVERDRYEQPWPDILDINYLLPWRRSWINRIRDAILVGCLAIVPTFALIVIVRVALEAWNAR
ncbi:MAG: hypothetical protein ACKO0W_09905 [Planctomycetota bacterium]